MVKTSTALSIAHQVDHGQIEMNPWFYCPPYWKTTEQPKFIHPKWLKIIGVKDEINNKKRDV